MTTQSAPVPLLRIGGETRETGSGGAFEHRNPYSGAPQATVALAGKPEMDEAVELAHGAFEQWRTQRPEARRDKLRALATLVRENADQFARMAALDGGTPVEAGRQGAALAAAWIDYYAGWCDKLSGEQMSTFDTRGEFAYTTPEPYGVIGLVITWNGPLISLGMKVAPALAAGNCVVVKPSELTPFAPGLFAELVQKAGIPPQVCSIVTGDGAAGDALVRHPLVRKVSFTGGPATARKILGACAEQLKPAVMELGGKSASLVFPDAEDLEAVCQHAVGWTIGVFAGQGCALPTRLLVHTDVHDQVLDRVVEIARGYPMGDPMLPGVAVGPLINEVAVDRVEQMLQRARRDGAGRFLLGGARPGGDLAGKNFIEPTVIADVDPEHEIVQQEIFGPVLLVQRFADEDEAVRLANVTDYGLAAYIQSRDVRRVHRLSERLRAGGVYVNGAVPINPHTAFGGVGISGFGKEGGRAGIDEFLHYKTVAIA